MRMKLPFRVIFRVIAITAGACRRWAGGPGPQRPGAGL